MSNVEGRSDAWYEPDDEDEFDCGFSEEECECISDEDWAVIAADFQLDKLKDEGWL